MNEEITEQNIVQKGTIKLTKNSKGFTWEIKVIEGFNEEYNNKMVNEVIRLHNQLNETLGGVL